MSSKTLIFVDTIEGDALSKLGRLYENNGSLAIVCLNNETYNAIENTSLSACTKMYTDYVSHDDWLQIDRDAMAWLKSIPECALCDGKAFRESFVTRGVSFWWFIEEFFMLNGGLFDYVKMYRACEAAIAQEEPERIHGFIADNAHDATIEHHALNAGCAVEWERRPSTSRGGIFSFGPKALLKNTVKLCIAILGPLSPIRMFHSALIILRRKWRGFTQTPGCILIFSTVPYSWRKIHAPDTGEDRFADSYWDAVENEIATSNPNQAVLHIAVRSNRAQDKSISGRLRYNARLLRNIPDYVPIAHYGTPASGLRVARACVRVFRMWNRASNDPNLASALCYGGVDFSQIIVLKIWHAIFGFLPGFARIFEESSNSLKQEQPSVVLLNGETTALGRILVTACRMHDVPTVGMQHGCISVLPSMHAAYYHSSADSVSHESTNNKVGCPIPTRTVVWGTYFQELLAGVMHYPADAVTVTGNPRYDVLHRSDEYDAGRIRRRLHLHEDKFTILLATSGASMKSDFQPPSNNRVHLAAVLDCLENMTDTQMIVKLHPLDDTTLYGNELNRAREHPDVRIVNEFDILALLSTADLLICRYSGTIIEAAMFHKPALNLNLLGTPDNIEFVAEGGAFSVTNTDDLPEAITALQQPTSQISRDLEGRRQRFIDRWALKADGLSASRVADEVMRVASRT